MLSSAASDTAGCRCGTDRDQALLREFKNTSDLAGVRLDEAHVTTPPISTAIRY